MKHGAYDYLTKPCSVDEIRLVVEQGAREARPLAREPAPAPAAARPDRVPDHRRARAPRMQEIFELVRQVAPTRANILITGESGTGKELIARAIHNLSERRDAPFVAVNCGAIPENLLESELFGHVKGSFTGAQRQQAGPVRGRRRRHALPRRDRRDGAAAAGEGAARDPGAHLPARRRHQRDPRRRAHPRARPTAGSSTRCARAASARTCSTG